MIIIGLNGRMHSGKDTAWEYIDSVARNEYGLLADRRGYADKLKLSAARSLGEDPVDYDAARAWCDELKENGTIRVSLDDDLGFAFSGREYLQWYGTESHRDVFASNFWVDALFPERRPDIAGRQGQREHVGKSFPGVDILVVTDCRFENEAQRILDLGGEVWHISADARLGPLPEDAHISERPLPGHLLTKTVRNDGSLTEFGSALTYALIETVSR